MTCLTEGGNPLPTLVWLRNGLPLKERSLLDQIDSTAVGKKSHQHSVIEVQGTVFEIQGKRYLTLGQKLFHFEVHY